MISVVSTKKLSPELKGILNPEVFMVKDYDFISIDGVNFDMPGDYNHFIFTSQNAVKYYFEKQGESGFQPPKYCYCVGEKTKMALEEKGRKVTKMAQNSTELGGFLIKNARNEHFLYLCGNLSRPELPAILEKAGMPLTRLRVYQTTLNPQVIEGPVDAVLFFSPSGVASYVLKNKIGEATAFCIGSTTADFARAYTDKIEIAKNQTVESLLEKLAGYHQSPKKL